MTSATTRRRGKAKKTLELIEAARDILSEIQPATVRAVCYRLFVAGQISDMSRASTSRVSVQLTYAREQGIIPWAWIVDETRAAEYVPSWADPDDFANSISRQYRRDNWVHQDARVEVWSEKGTVRGTLEPVLREYGITFRVMHGFSSATTTYDIAQMIADEERRVVIFYLGDWDPSGLYMSDVDLPRRLREYGAAPAVFTRLALTREDTSDPGLPSFEAADKRRDPRYRWFTARYGAQCWELDALSPVILRDRVAAAIREEIEWAAWDRCVRAEEAEIGTLREVLGGWAEAMHR